MLYSWNVEYCLELPAVTFFAMRRQGLKSRNKFTSSVLAELVNIVQAPNLSPEASRDLYSFYLGQSDDLIKKRSKKGMDPTDPEVMRTMVSTFTHARKLMGH